MTSSNDKEKGYGSKFPYDPVRDEALEDIVTQWSRPRPWILAGGFPLFVLGGGYWLGSDHGPRVAGIVLVALVALTVGAALHFKRRPRKGSASKRDTSS